LTLRVTGVEEIGNPSYAPDAVAALVEYAVFPGYTLEVDYDLGGGWDVSGTYQVSNIRLDVPANVLDLTLRRPT
jgi:hypothetical protein